MAKNRKAAEAVILKWIARIDSSGTNTKMYKENLKKTVETILVFAKQK